MYIGFNIIVHTLVDDDIKSSIIFVSPPLLMLFTYIQAVYYYGAGVMGNS